MVTKVELVARYGETDQMGVIHHGVYPLWYEAARTELIKEATGMSYGAMEEMGLMPPLTELTGRYIRPCKFEDRIRVEAYFSKLTPAKIEIIYEVYRNDEDTPANIGKTILGWVDKANYRPLSLKKCYPDLYRKIEAALETERAPR